MSDPPAHRAARGPWLWVVFAALAALVGGVIGAAISHVWWTGPDIDAAACTASSVADQVLPSVVTIEVGRAGNSPSGTGSGEFFQTGGYILTNNHVVANAANGASLEVVLADGQRLPASLVGRDPMTDLAVIKASEATSAR